MVIVNQQIIRLVVVEGRMRWKNKLALLHTLLYYGIHMRNQHFQGHLQFSNELL